jgi:hypothetical protein
MNSDLINAVTVQSNGDIVAVGITLNKTTGNGELALPIISGSSGLASQADVGKDADG